MTNGYRALRFNAGFGTTSMTGCVCQNCGSTVGPVTLRIRPYPYRGWVPGWTMNWGLGGLRTWGGTYSLQYTMTGLPTDEEIVEMIYDSIDAYPTIPMDADVDVSVEAGRVTLSGTVPNKRIKHAAGDDSWWVPGVVDVCNELQVTGRRRSRSAPREDKS